MREILWAELLEIVNTGKGCTGFRNSGDWNSGDWNSGDRNSGNRNSGSGNSGSGNSGSGNSGDWNSGDWNSGDWNSGNRNSGDWNSGNRNSGDWNITNYSNGCFNTTEPLIYLFDKPSEWTYEDWLASRARYLLSQILSGVYEWIWFSEMTDSEKEENPNAKVTNGYLKKLDNTDCAADWWRSLSDDDKSVILAIPNFDKAIFKKITGIDIDAGE